MGGETSVSEQNTSQLPSPNGPPQPQQPLPEQPSVRMEEEEEDFFLLEPLPNIQLAPQRQVAHYLVAPPAVLPPHTLPALRQLLTRVEHLADLRTLRQELAFVGPEDLVKVIVSGEDSAAIEFLQREQRVHQIAVVGGEPPVPLRKAVAVDSWEALPGVLQELLGHDALSAPASTLLLADEDTDLLNKYRLNFHCATRFSSRAQAKADFLALARHLYPQAKAEVDRFEQQYDLSLEGEARARMALEWAFAGGFFWEMVDQVARNTRDPKRVAYVRLAVRDLYEAVRWAWRERSYVEVFVVVEVSEEERRKLEAAQGRFLLFTSFVKGYSSEKDANLDFRQRPHAFKFILTPNRRPFEDKLDFGLAILPRQPHNPRPNVLLNIYNVLKVKGVTGPKREGELETGALAENFKQREVNRQTMSEGELSLVRNYDYLEDMMGKIDGQATLLQLSGYLRDSLTLYDRRAHSLRRSASTHQEIERCAVLKGDALRRSGQWEAAEREYEGVQEGRMRVVALVRLAELSLHRGWEAKFEAAVAGVAAGVEELRGQREEYFRARNLLAIRMIKQGQHREAIPTLRRLIQEITESAGRSFEGRPAIHDSYRCLATCLARCGDPTGAINILRDTLGWQLSCEGHTPNVALTQTLIRSVARSTTQEEPQEQQDDLAKTSELAFGDELLRSLRGEGKAEQRQKAVEQEAESGEKRKEIEQSAVHVELSQSAVRVEVSETAVQEKTS